MEKRYFECTMCWGKGEGYCFVELLDMPMDCSNCPVSGEDEANWVEVYPKAKESPADSPASPVQQAKDAIKPADYEYCPHCHGSFSFAKLGSDFKCKWCNKDVRTSGRLA